MKRIGHLFLTFAVISCALVEPHSEETLYNEYQESKTPVDSNDKTGANRKLLNAYLENKTKAEKNIPPELGLASSFWNHLAYEIRTEHSYFEKVADDSSCLTLNGLDKENRPSPLSLLHQ